MKKVCLFRVAYLCYCDCYGKENRVTNMSAGARIQKTQIPALKIPLCRNYVNKGHSLLIIIAAKYLLLPAWHPVHLTGFVSW